MDSNNHPEDEEFSFFDISKTENESQFDDLWLLLNTGERIYLGYPDDLCRQCFQTDTDLMLNGGHEWWKQNGSACDMIFLLSDDEFSLMVLRNYSKEMGMETDL